MSAGGQMLDTRLLRYRGGGGEDNPVGLAEELILAGRPSDAVDVLAIRLKSAPDDQPAMLMEGRAKFAAGDLLGAQASLLKLARLTPRDKEPFRWLGEVLLKRGDPARASKVLERAHAIDADDRAVNRLLERAQRLAQVADGGAPPAPPSAPPPAPPPAPTPAPQPPDERTVIRTDLTNQLRQITGKEDVHQRPTAQAQAYKPGISAPGGLAQPLSFDDSTSEVRDAELHLVSGSAATDFDDEPTNVLSAGASPLTAISAQAIDAVQAPAPRDPFAPPPSARRDPFGAVEAATKPRARPLVDVEPPTTIAGKGFADADDVLTAIGKRNVGATTSTSPGAATAPTPPPPRRQLGAKASQPFVASDEEIEGALGALGGPPSSPAPPAAPSRPAGMPSPFDDGDPFAPATTTPAAAALASQPLTPEALASQPLTPEALAPQPLAPQPLTPEALAPQPLAPPPFAAREEAPFAAPAPEPMAPVSRDSGPPDEDDFEDEPMFGRGSQPLADALGTGGVENVDSVLSMLREQGLFEPPGSQAATWAARGEVKKAQAGGTRIGLWMGLVWVLAIGLVVGGYFGWKEWVRMRHEESADLVAQATAEAYRGSHADLVDAERHLTDARALNPHDVAGPTLLLFVQSQAALEDGAFDPVHIRPALQRAEALEAEGEEAQSLEAYMDVARAVLEITEGSHNTARQYLVEALEARPEDAAILYMVGRLEQRIGGDEALEHLTAASEADEELLAPRIALAEALYDDGRADDALELIDGILENHHDHLRARMWQAFMTADNEEPEPLLASIRELRDSLHPSFFAPTDNVLFHLTSARLLRRTEENEEASEAVDGALQAGATEPRLLALVAIEGKRAGRLRRAEMAARTAVANAPSNTDFRKLLAEIQLLRQNGRDALETLAQLPNEDPDVLEMRAQAALLLRNAEALAGAAAGLDEHVEATEEPSVAIRALRIRLHTAMGEAEAILPEARALAAEAPGDVDASLALGEAALRLYDSDTAVENLEQVVTASPDNAEGHYLLGRARRMAADPEGAEQSLRRAVELTPEHTDAKINLAGLLLDTGQYEQADEVYRELANSMAGGRAVAMSGRLGRVEALIGLGNLGDAQVQFDGVPEEVRETPTGRETGARLSLAQGQPGEALSQLRPIARGDDARPAVLALYGEALLAARQAEPASAAFDAAVEADAGLPEGLLGQAELAVRSERADDAAEILGRVERALERRIRPPAMHARFHTLVGRTHLLGDRGSDAATALRAAIATEAAPPEAHFFLGEALAGDDSPGSRAAYETYLELAPEGRYASRAQRAIH